jgi:precorrin-6B methylase 2
MRVMTDWAALWRELSLAQRQRERQRTPGEDAWQERAHHYQARAHRRWSKPDSSRQAVAAALEAAPGATLLDIGAGTGAWVRYLAPRASRITAIEPSTAMISVLRETLAAEGITNVEIVQAPWPDAAVEPHDFSLCSHAMYGSPDLPAFVTRMEQVTRRTCFLVLRAPAFDSVMAEAARHVWGHPHDSPNFQVAYNVLLEMGIRPNVLFEGSGHWEPWTSTSLEAALADVKKRLLLTSDEHDAYLLELLDRRLARENGELVWPRDMRSALVYWQAGER